MRQARPPALTGAGVAAVEAVAVVPARDGRAKRRHLPKRSLTLSRSVPNRARLRTHAATSVPHLRPKRRRRRPSTKSPASSGGSAVFSNAPEPKREGFANTTVARIRAPVRAAQSQAEPARRSQPAQDGSFPASC
jgi:hypothetical protein